MKSLHELVMKVRNVFGESPPNGILLGWDEDRFYASLSMLCRDCRVVNETDFNYSYCNSFQLEPNHSVRDHDYVLTFKTSFVADAFSVHVTRYTKDRKQGKVVGENECPELLPALETVRRFAEESGFQEVDGLAQDIVIEGVSLELGDPATLGKCLFDDFESQRDGQEEGRSCD